MPQLPGPLLLLTTPPLLYKRKFRVLSNLVIRLVIIIIAVASTALFLGYSFEASRSSFGWSYKVNELVVQ